MFRTDHLNIGLTVTNVLREAARAFAQWHQKRLDRAAFKNMLTLDDSLLRDIGVTRADVEWASQLPMDQNAACELRKLSRMTRTQPETRF